MTDIKGNGMSVPKKKADLAALAAAEAKKTEWLAPELRVTGYDGAGSIDKARRANRLHRRRQPNWRPLRGANRGGSKTDGRKAARSGIRIAQGDQSKATQIPGTDWHIRITKTRRRNHVVTQA